MKKQYCVSLLLKKLDDQDCKLITYKATDVLSKMEALGKAVSSSVSDGSLCRGWILKDYSFKSFDIKEEEDFEDKKKELKLKSFLNLIDEISPYVTRHTFSFMPEYKIEAIKYIRTFVMGYLGLKECKQIIDVWTAEGYKLATPYNDMVRHHLLDLGYDKKILFLNLRDKNANLNTHF